MVSDQIKALAKQAGGTPYTNRHYPGETAVAFGPVALAEFVRLVRESAETKPAKGLFIDMIAEHEGLAEELTSQPARQSNEITYAHQ